MKRELKLLKKLQAATVCAAVLLFCLPVRAFAISFDGNVLKQEWAEYPAIEPFGAPSQCGITYAKVYTAVQPAQYRVVFGVSAIAPGAEAGSPVGAAFWLGGREIGRWQLGLGGDFDAANYDLQGLAYIPEIFANSAYTFEIALGYKNDAALTALRDLYLELIDPQGVSSRLFPCPIVAAEPTTTTKAATTEKTTTAKAPTTEKTTTTKAPTTEKTTTTKATTTPKATTVPPVYTTAPPAYAPSPQAGAASSTHTSTATQAGGAAPTSPAQQPSGTSRTEVVWYTEIYTGAPADAPVGADEGQQTLWPYEAWPAEASQAQSLPTLAMPASQASRPAAANPPLLYAAVVLLVLLAAAMIFLWFRAQKKTETAEE